jgi:hypothetical protein
MHNAVNAFDFGAAILSEYAPKRAQQIAKAAANIRVRIGLTRITVHVDLEKQTVARRSPSGCSIEDNVDITFG